MEELKFDMILNRIHVRIINVGEEALTFQRD